MEIPAFFLPVWTLWAVGSAAYLMVGLIVGAVAFRLFIRHKDLPEDFQFVTTMVVLLWPVFVLISILFFLVNLVGYVIYGVVHFISGGNSQ